jgi:hypothetical protein
VAASQATRLTIGSGPNANSKRSLFSHETGIVFNSGLLQLRELKLIFSPCKQRKGETNDDADLIIVIGLAFVLAAAAYTSRSRKYKEPMQLGVGRKLRRQEFGNQR